jgi:asparagine synthase (glutamine-hydrolysing)
MCGIFGVLAEAGRVSERDVIHPLDALRHRGPDAEGFWSDGRCALGHRRLAIIDLSEAGRQPLSNEDGNVWITFNGEVYNFQALRQELTGLGHQFRTLTDTEVIVHAYEQWGTDCLRRFRGMFAFGIWDARRRRLFLARDRVGKKPLFYTRQAGQFLFASELQGLLVNPQVPRDVDLESIDYYMSWGYIPAPATAFRGIFKLPPAHWMTIDLANDTPEIRSECYWYLEYEPKLQISENEACDVLRDKLAEAVRLRMISDVPLGAFLSGGIDSSIVVGLMAQASSRPVRTFSIGFSESAYNELPHARRIAERWRTEHHEFVVHPDAMSILPLLVRHYGEPFADSSAVPTFYVSQVTRRSVTVALNGDGGDENFLGYERYLGNRIADRLCGIPGMRHAAPLIARCLPIGATSKDLARRARRFLSVAGYSEVERYGKWIGYCDRETKAQLYGGELRAALDDQTPMHWMATLFRGAANVDRAEAASAVDVSSYLPYDLLVKVDITSMANGLEARSPMLDHEVMEFAARLPSSFKLRGRQSKYLLRRAFADLLPWENANRRKSGFGIPVGLWFRGPLRDLLGDSLLSDRSLNRGYFNADEVRRLVNQHWAGRADHSFLLWSLLMLELWHQEMVDRTPTVAAFPVLAS